MTDENELFERLEEEFPDSDMVYKIVIQFYLPSAEDEEKMVQVTMPLLSPQGLTEEEVRIYTLGAQASAIGVLRILGHSLTPAPLQERSLDDDED